MNGSSERPGELAEIADRLVWWKPPVEAMTDPRRLLAQVMVYGTAEDIVAARRHFPESAFGEVLANPPPGLFDPRSWAYWHAVLGLGLPEEIPGRNLDRAD